MKLEKLKVELQKAIDYNVENFRVMKEVDEGVVSRWHCPECKFVDDSGNFITQHMIDVHKWDFIKKYMNPNYREVLKIILNELELIEVE